MGLFTLLCCLFIIMLPFALPIILVKLISRFIKSRRVSEGEDGVSETETAPAVRTRTTRPEREKMNGSGIMLLLGTVFIVLSGIAFGVAGWVNTSEVGRTLIIAAAAVISFGISYIFRKVFRLTGTSTAFYCVGSVLSAVTAIIAGFYELLGEYISTYGDGACLLYTLSAAIAAVFSMAGYKLYSQKTFAVVGLSFTAVTLHFMIAQFSWSFESYAAAAAVVQAVITAVLHILKPQKSLSFAKEITLVGDFTSVFFALISTSFLIFDMDNADISAAVISAMYAVQLAFYGAKLNKGWMKGLQSIFSAYTLYVLTDAAVSGKNREVIVFAFLSFALYLINRFVPYIKTAFSESSTLATAEIAAIAAVNVYKRVSFTVSIIPLLLISAAILSYAFHKNKGTQIAAGLLFPLNPLIIASHSRHLLFGYDLFNRTEAYVYSFGVLAVILTAIAALIVFLPKYAFDFYARHPRTSDAILYSCMIVSGSVMLNPTAWDPVQLMILMLAPFHFYISGKLRNNLCTAFSILTSVTIINNWLSSEITSSRPEISLFMEGVFIILMVLSRIFFRNALVEKTESGIKADTPLLCSIQPMLIMTESAKYGTFLFFFACAVMTAFAVKRNTGHKRARILMTASAILTATAIIFRPFLVPGSDMVSAKITLAVIAATGLAFRLIWRDYHDFAYNTSDRVWKLCFTALILDAMYFHKAGNTIFDLAVTAGILVLSYAVKSRGWFRISAIFLAYMTIYASRKYLMSLNWWVYLFLVGLVLISAAAVNEYSKKNGEDIRDRFKSRFAGWQR